MMPTEFEMGMAARDRLNSLLKDRPNDLSHELARLTDVEFISLARIIRASFFDVAGETVARIPPLLNYLRDQDAQWWCNCFPMTVEQVINKAITELPVMTKSRH